MNNKIEILVRDNNDEKWRKETISYISDKFDGSLLSNKQCPFNQCINF